MLKHMLSILNKYNLIVKDHMYSKQMIMDDIIDYDFEQYKIELDKCLKEYKELLKKSF